MRLIDQTLLALTLMVGGSLVGATGCADDDLGEDGGCVANEQRACGCTDGSMSAQTCAADGSGFEECVCSGGDGDGDGDGEPSIPSWTDDMVPFFQQSCGSGLEGCHRRSAYGADAEQDCRGWLTLEDVALGSEYYAGDMEGQPTGCEDMVLLERLLTLAPWQCDPDISYVVPGDPEASYLYRKIAGLPLCDLGTGDPSEWMPPEGAGWTLEQEQIDMVAAWILAGAPYDGD